MSNMLTRPTREKRYVRLSRPRLSYAVLQNKWQMFAVLLSVLICVLEFAQPAARSMSLIESVCVLLSCALIGAGALLILVGSPDGPVLCRNGSIILIVGYLIPLLSIVYSDSPIADKAVALPSLLTEMCILYLPTMGLLYCISRRDWAVEHKASGEQST